MAFTGHVLRGSIGEDALKPEAITARERPKRVWLHDT